MRRIIACENQKNKGKQHETSNTSKTALALLVGWYAANAAAYSEQGQAVIPKAGKALNTSKTGA